MKKKRAIEILVICAVTLVTALFLETVMFHIPYFIKQSSYPDSEELSLDKAFLFGCARTDAEGNIFITNASDASIRFNDLPEFRSIRLYGYGEQGYKTMNITVSDPDSGFEMSSQHRFSPSSLPSMYFDTNVGGSSFILSFKDCASMTITKIAINTLPDYEIFPIRLVIVWLILIFAVCAVKYKLFKVVFEKDNPVHSAAIAFTVFLLCCVSTLISSFNGALTVPYPLTDATEKQAYGNYVQQADAFIKGQINLDIEVPDKLFECENPYDPQNRYVHRVSTNNIWDKAFYDGKLYSYFGVAPVILVYMPVYLLTGRMATDMLCCYIFSLISVVSVCLLLRELVIRYVKKAHLVMLCFGMAAVCAAGLVFVMESSANFYTVAVMGAIAFVPSYLYLSLRACRGGKVSTRCILFALAGLCLAFTVGCRPNAAVYGLLTIPAMIGVLRERGTDAKKKIMMVASFALPICVGVGALMWYNAIRFSGPLDFGNNYQITVSDTSQNTLRFHLLPQALFHYFLQLPTVNFPLATMSRIKLMSYNVDYIYIGENLGAAAFVCNWALVPSLYFWFKQRKNEQNWFVALCLGIAVALAFTDMCMAGAHIRYTADIALIVALASVITFINADGRAGKRLLTLFGIFLFAVTVYTGLVMTLDNEVDLIMHNSADLLLFLKRMLGA